MPAVSVAVAAGGVLAAAGSAGAQSGDAALTVIHGVPGPAGARPQRRRPRGQGHRGRHHPGRGVLTRAALHPLQAPAAASGKVTVTAAAGARDVEVTTDHLPVPGKGHYYEVRLLDPTTLKMMPMGALPPSGQASFGVATSLTAGYSAVDISLQANDGNPAHSRVSVPRGALGS